MDCRDFRDIAADLARKQVRGGTIDEHAAAHARACEACAMLLAAEQRLAAGLHALQVRDDGLEAPPHLESALLRQLRVVNRLAPAARPGSSARWRWWAVAAAAAAVVLVVWPGSRRQQPLPSSSTVSMDVPKERERVNEPAPPAVEAPEAAPAPATASVKPPVAANLEVPGNTGRPQAKPGQRRPQPVAPSEMIAAAAGSMAEKPAAAATAAPGREVVTDFVPLTYGGWNPSAPEARLVRVRLPAAALLYFGFPAAAGTTSVEADVVLGEDGLAHAVRFVGLVMASADLSERGRAPAQQR
jgi:hypothetical protein